MLRSGAFTSLKLPLDAARELLGIEPALHGGVETAFKEAKGALVLALLAAGCVDPGLSSSESISRTGSTIALVTFKGTVEVGGRYDVEFWIQRQLRYLYKPLSERFRAGGRFWLADIEPERACAHNYGGPCGDADVIETPCNDSDGVCERYEYSATVEMVVDKEFEEDLKNAIIPVPRFMTRATLGWGGSEEAFSDRHSGCFAHPDNLRALDPDDRWWAEYDPEGWYRIPGPGYEFHCDTDHADFADVKVTAVERVDNGYDDLPVPGSPNYETAFGDRALRVLVINGWSQTGHALAPADDHGRENLQDMVRRSAMLLKRPRIEASWYLPCEGAIEDPENDAPKMGAVRPSAAACVARACDGEDCGPILESATASSSSGSALATWVEEQEGLWEGPSGAHIVLTETDPDRETDVEIVFVDLNMSDAVSGTVFRSRSEPAPAAITEAAADADLIIYTGHSREGQFMNALGTLLGPIKQSLVVMHTCYGYAFDPGALENTDATVLVTAASSSFAIGADVTEALLGEYLKHGRSRRAQGHERRFGGATYEEIFDDLVDVHPLLVAIRNQ